MNKQKARYRKIMNEVIEKSFPILRDKKIFIFEFKWKIFGGFAFWFSFFFLLGVNKQLRTLSERRLKGLLSHELAHFEIYYRKGFCWFLLMEAFYWLIRPLRRKLEYDTDKFSIRRGYARENYAYTLWWWNTVKRKGKKWNNCYMKPEEIKAYAKEVGKW